jgi:hypothetical protein
MTDEQLDRVYRDFFRHEAPREMPPLVKSEVRRPAAVESRSRWVLAASIAALIGLGLLVSSQMSPTRDGVKGSATKLFDNTAADGEKLVKPEMP